MVARGRLLTRNPFAVSSAASARRRAGGCVRGRGLAPTPTPHGSLPVEQRHDVARAGDQSGVVLADQAVASTRGGRGQWAGDRAETATESGGVASRIQGSRPPPRLRNNGHSGESRQDPVPRKKPPLRRRCVQGDFGDDCAALSDPSDQLRVPRRVGPSDPTGDNCDGGDACGEGGAVRGSVDPIGRATEDRDLVLCEVGDDLVGDVLAVPCRGPGSHDSDFSAVLRWMQDPRDSPCRKSYTAPQWCPRDAADRSCSASRFRV